MALLNKQTVLEHLYKRLIETANNNVGFECDAGIVFEEIATDRIKTWLDEVQTVDAEPVRHGKWLCSDDMYETAVCSVCNCDTEEPYEYVKKSWNFCQNCGAKMDAKRKEE